MRKHTAKLTKYSLKKETITKNGKKLKTNRIQATIIVNGSFFTKSDAQKIDKEKEGHTFYYVMFMNMKTGKQATIYSSPNSTQKEAQVHTRMNKTSAFKLADGSMYYYYGKWKITIDCNFPASEKVAFGICGGTKKISKKLRFFMV